MKRFLILLFSLPVLALADTQCLVVKVADGDTFSCRLHNQDIVKVRLADIDAPESSQAYNQKILGINIEKKDKAMAFLNQATIMGNLGCDPNVRYFADNTPTCKFTVATKKNLERPKRQ